MKLHPSSNTPGGGRYIVEHETHYSYVVPVSQSWQLGRLTPRMLPWQRVVSHSLSIEPLPNERHEATDSFGNVVTHFGLHGAHHQLRVRMHCQVEVAERPRLETDHAMTVAEVREAVRRQLLGANDLEAARMAVLHAKGLMQVGEQYLARSIIDSEFACHIDAEVAIGSTRGIVPVISGTAWITGTHQHTLDPSDPWPQGYRLSDTWPMPRKP